MVRDGIGVPFYGARRFALSGVAALRLRYDIHFRARLRQAVRSLFPRSPCRPDRAFPDRCALPSRRHHAQRLRLLRLIWWAYRSMDQCSPCDRRAGQGGYGVGRGIAMRPGDILVFDTRRGRTGLHTALYTGNGRFVHSPTSGKRVREDSLSQEYWKKRLIRVRRIVR